MKLLNPITIALGLLALGAGVLLLHRDFTTIAANSPAGETIKLPPTFRVSGNFPPEQLKKIVADFQAGKVEAPEAIRLPSATADPAPHANVLLDRSDNPACVGATYDDSILQQADTNHDGIIGDTELANAQTKLPGISNRKNDTSMIYKAYYCQHKFTPASNAPPAPNPVEKAAAFNDPYCPYNTTQAEQCGGGQIEKSDHTQCTYNMNLNGGPSFYENCNYGNNPNVLGHYNTLSPEHPEPRCSTDSTPACACQPVNTPPCGTVLRLFPPGCIDRCCPPLPVSCEQCCAGSAWLYDTATKGCACAVGP